MKRRTFSVSKPSLAKLQNAMNLYKPPEGFAHAPAFMSESLRTPSTGPRQHLEADFQVSLFQYLNTQPRILAWATPNSTWVGKMTPQKLGYLAKQKRMGVRKGLPDVCLFFRNRHGQPTFCFCELKAGHNKASDEQNHYMDECNARGGYSAVVRTIEDLKALLEVAQY